MKSRHQKLGMSITYKVGHKEENGWRYDTYNTYEEAIVRISELLEWYNQITIKREKRFTLDK